MPRAIFVAAALLVLSASATSSAPLPFLPQPPVAKSGKRLARAHAAPDDEREELRDAVADKKTINRLYVSQALGRLSEGDAAGAVELSARALALDPSDESAFAVLRLAEGQMRANAEPHPAPGYRDAVSGRGGVLAPAPGAHPAFVPEAAAMPGREFWRLVFSPVIGFLLLGMAVAHVMLGRVRKRSLETIAARRAAQPSPDKTARLPALPHDYSFLRTIGEGGMGVVYEAEDRRLGRKVAVKKMRDEIKRDQKERAHFLDEARLVAGLHHPTIVDIHTILEHGEDMYLVFEYIEGKTLEKLLEERRYLPLPETKLIMRGVCEALEYAHRHGVVHRDLKPSNVMVTPEGDIKVMDFGVARRAKDSLMRFTLTETIAGTPLYMAPEAEDGIVRREADVYALGACLYEMLTGEHPFPSPTTRAAKLGMRYVAPSRQRAGVPAEVDALIDWALQPDPDRRLPTPRGFLKRLEEIN